MALFTSIKQFVSLHLLQHQNVPMCGYILVYLLSIKPVWNILLVVLLFNSGKIDMKHTITVVLLYMRTFNHFSVNLGLKQALETVNDYNPLMKDFPLNDLLSATELDKIRQALVAIFTHLRKIRNTKYPIQRALRLVEAISRDLSSQLLKVLGTRKLMHVAYEEFEKVSFSPSEIQPQGVETKVL